MERTQSTGWRSMGEVAPMIAELEQPTKVELFEAARLACKVLEVAPAARFLLEQLCGFYRGEPIEGRLLVWPSNELLSERTGLGERTIRYAARQLLDLELISAKDSPNGKRFAQRSAQGQILTAYGFDLSPLLARLNEFRERHAGIKERARQRARAFDELTIHRRATQEALRALAERFPAVSCADLTQRAAGLLERSVRRSSRQAVDPIRDDWRELREEAESRYYTACGGKDRRHKDINNDAPDQSCDKGREDDEPAAAPEEHIELSDLVAACPEAIAFTGPVRTERELVSLAAQYRGAFGVNINAWEEACVVIGPVVAAAVFFLVIQLQAGPARGAPPIRNPGGYYRAMVRMVRDGRVNLAVEIQKRKKGPLGKRSYSQERLVTLPKSPGLAHI